MGSNFLHFNSPEEALQWANRTIKPSNAEKPAKNICIPSEHEEQAALIYWCDVMSSKYPELKLIYAIPNGGFRNKSEAARLSKEGVKSGVPDLFLPVPKDGYHGLYIEMKRQDRGGGTSENQDWWIKELIHQGYYVRVCNGFNTAKEYILYYLNISKVNGL